jgi:hypothetical protein
MLTPNEAKSISGVSYGTINHGVNRSSKGLSHANKNTSITQHLGTISGAASTDGWHGDNRSTGKSVLNLGHGQWD